MIGSFGRRASAITLDVGCASVQAVQLARCRGATVIAEQLNVDLRPHEALAVPEAGLELDASRVARLLARGRFRGREVTFSLAPPNVAFQPLRLADRVLSRPPDEVAEAVRFEVAREMRKAPEELEVRYWKLPSASPNVMAVAMSSARAAQWFADFEQQGLTLRGLQPAPCALVEAALRQFTPGPTDGWGILDLGFHRSLLTVVVCRTPIYVRSIHVCGGAMTRLLAEAFDMSFVEAERLKCTSGILPADESAPPVPSGAPDAEARELPWIVLGLLRRPLDELAKEIVTCFSYAMQNLPELSVQRLLLAGGGANLRGLPGFLETQLGVQVEVLGPGQSEEPNSIPFSPSSAAAIGGALLDLEAR